MKYIVMCGGEYRYPKQLVPILGEPVCKRTIRLLHEAGANDICISATDRRFEEFGVPVLKHCNPFQAFNGGKGCWADAFYPLEQPACYIMGDVVFSPNAIKTIVETRTEDIAFFASAPPFHPMYPKAYAEPFAFKVEDQRRFRAAINYVKANENTGIFQRRPIAWELWQVIKGTPLNLIPINYQIINDYTCDIDSEEDAQTMENLLRGVNNA